MKFPNLFRPVELLHCAMFGHFYSNFTPYCRRCGKKVL
jgi:hypothetical protein